MTKQEQIEEMANYYCEYCKSQTGDKFCEHIEDKSCNIFFEAELFYNAGYRKSDEYEADIEYLTRRIAELEQDLVHADENVFFREQNVVLYEEKIKSEVRKETAKEILQCLYDKCYEIQNMGRGGIAHVSPIDILQLAKHYGVEVEE